MLFTKTDQRGDDIGSVEMTEAERDRQTASQTPVSESDLAVRTAGVRGRGPSGR